MRKSSSEPWGAIFLARLRLDGFASLHASERPGSVVTVPVKATGKTLYVNADASEGELQIEVRAAKDTGTAGGNPLWSPAVPIQKNGIALPTRWREPLDFSNYLGQEVQIRFTLRNTHLYAFWFGE